jgi:hypothetical protein
MVVMEGGERAWYGSSSPQTTSPHGSIAQQQQQQHSASPHTHTNSHHQVYSIWRLLEDTKKQHSTSPHTHTNTHHQVKYWRLLEDTKRAALDLSTYAHKYTSPGIQ